MNDHLLEHSQDHENNLRQTHESQASEVVRFLEKVQQTMDSAQFLRAGNTGLQALNTQSADITMGNTAKWDDALHEFDRTARIQNAQLHKLDSEVIQAQIYLAEKAEANKLSAPGVEALQSDLQREHAVLSDLRRTVEAAEMRAVGQVQSVISNGGNVATIEAATKQMSDHFARALESAGNRLDELQHEKGTERVALERNGMADCKYANTAARDSVVIPQDWGRGDRIALTLSPGDTRMFSGKVGAGSVLDVQVVTAGSRVSWNAGISGDAFFLSRDKRTGQDHLSKDIAGQGHDVQVTVVLPKGATNTVVQENASQQTKGSGELHGELGVKRGPVEATVGGALNGERATRNAELVRTENRGAEQQFSMSVRAEVCFDRPPRPEIHIHRGAR